MEEEHGPPALRIMAGRGAEQRARADKHDLPLFLAINGMDHPKASVTSPQPNGIHGPAVEAQ